MFNIYNNTKKMLQRFTLYSLPYLTLTNSRQNVKLEYWLEIS